MHGIRLAFAGHGFEVEIKSALDALAPHYSYLSQTSSINGTFRYSKPSGPGNVGILNSSNDNLLALYVGHVYVGRRQLDLATLGSLGDQPSTEKVVQWSTDLRGNFALALWFPRASRAYVVTDQTSSMPIYWCKLGNVVVISPKTFELCKIARLTGERATIRRNSIYEFIASGHLWGDGTYWDQIHRLGPGRILALTAEGESLHSYWELSIEEVSQSWSEASAKLEEGVRADIDRLPTGNALLALSGGYDSRGLLGLLQKAGRAFETISYSFGDIYAGDDDMSVGSYFASKLGVKHNIYRADLSNAVRVIKDFVRCVEITGGESDVATAQEVMLGEDFHREASQSFSYMLRGDEVWGYGDNVLSKKMALWQVFLLTLDQLDGPSKVLRKCSFDEGIQELLNYQFKLLGEAGRNGPNQIKDYLLWRHRVARSGNVANYYTRNFIPHYAPYLFGDSMEVVRKLPQQMRIRKRLYMRTMERMFPKLFSDRKSPDKLTPIKGRFHILYESPHYLEFVRHTLLDDPPSVWFDIFDRNNLRVWFERTTKPEASENSANQFRYNLGRRAYDLFRHSEWALGVVMAVAVGTGKVKFPTQNENFLNRLLTLAQVLKMAEKC